MQNEYLYLKLHEMLLKGDSSLVLVIIQGTSCQEWIYVGIFQMTGCDLDSLNTLLIKQLQQKMTSSQFLYRALEKRIIHSW